jgi:hypothetical protein
MNIVEEWVVALGFNKENPKKFLTPCDQQSQGLSRLNHPMATRSKLDLGGGEPHPI